MPLEPDRNEIETFFHAMFKHCGDVGYASMRAFLHSSKPLVQRLWRAPVAHRQNAVDVAVDMARRAANNSEPAVFCPPVSVFNGPDGKAREKDLYLGLAISVECDQRPNEARQLLQEILGEATVIVKSGGVWLNGGDEPEDKLHLHWRLAKPAEKAEHEKLKRVRRLAALIVGGDHTSDSAVHCLRCPGSWHRKDKDHPRLAKIWSCNPDREIDLNEALAALEAAAPPEPQQTESGSDDRQANADWQALFSNILEGASLHASLRDLAATMIRSGMGGGVAVNQLRALMNASKAPRDDRWQARLNEIPRLVESAEQLLKPKAPALPPPLAAARPLAEVHKVFSTWLGKDYDLDVLNAVLAAAAAERLEGDPLWLLVISGPGNAKTETVQALAGAGAHVTSTISSEGALLSATPQRQRAKQATGGLLRKIGDKGVLVIKDVTSILSADRNVRGPVLAAIREIYDGRWERNVGIDGGRTLTWNGRIVVVGACTTAWDAAHVVISTMGDRFVLIRADSTVARINAATRAIGNVGHEKAMREELAQAAGGLIGAADKTVRDLDDEETAELVRAADIVTSARTAVERDYRGEVVDAHAPEMPTRFAKQLAQLVRGAIAIRIADESAMRLAIRCARDSIPPLRREILLDIAPNPDSKPNQVYRRINRPRSTVRRELQALHMLRLLKCDERDEEHDGKTRAISYYSLADDFSRETLTAMTGAPGQLFLPLKAAPAQKKQGAGAKKAAGLTPREIIDGARGAGAKFNLWQDGAGFDLDLTFVTDAMLRDEFISRVRDNHDAILGELRREAGHAPL
jgi:hypothetical protein